jgi:beta-lactamase regulating signal transducer with metallopeptidase domain
MLQLHRTSRLWRPETVGGFPTLISPSFGPAVVGVVNPGIVIPEWVLPLPRSDRELILAHENSHRSAGDSRVLLASAVVTVLFPWNASGWLLARRLRLAVEIDCDSRVIGTRVAPTRYASLLVSVAEHALNNGRRPIRPHATVIAQS